VLASDSTPVEITIVDNASTDRTRTEVSRYLSKPNVKLVQKARNVGFAGGVNAGVANSNGSLILLLNPDAYLEAGCLAQLVRAFGDGCEGLLIAQPKILRASSPGKIDSTGDFIDSYGFGIRRGGDPALDDHGQHDDSTEIFSARGAALMTTRTLFDLADGLDASFFVLYEDVDFCWRARMLGAEVVYVPEARVLHDTSASMSYELRAFHGTKNRLMMLMKNYEPHNLIIRFAPAVVMGLWLSLGEFVSARSLRRGMLRLKGILWVILRLQTIWKERILIQRMRRVRDREIVTHMLNGNIVFLQWIRSFVHGGIHEAPYSDDCEP
jgi:GT2 family glycosyltransferase